MPTLILHTFVICAYKESPYLEVAIRSALAQESVSADRSRVILYTSTPNAFIRGLCDKYGIAVFSGNGRGIGSDWNHAVACATTNYVTLVHQDDVYEKEYGAAVIAAFEEKKDATLVFSDYYEMDGSGERRPRNLNLKIKTAALRLMMLSKNKTYQRRIFAFGDFISCPAVSYN
ncbi:MAG: glycosyltransferase, partial [Streptococcaceae bacterium]|nr:glycosyltransferase [Streptococcaceae bacterium]